MFSWKDGSNVTVLDQPWTQTLEITETSLAGAIKSKEIETAGTETMEQPKSSEGSDGSSGGLAWWAWLLIAVGIILVLGGIAYMCMGDDKKSKKKKKTTNKTAARDLESAQSEQKQPLVSPQATGSAAASGVAPVVQQQYVSTPLIMPQAQSPIAMPVVQTGVMSIPAGSVPAQAQYVSSQVYQSGGMSAAAAQDMFTQLDVNGDGVLSPQELAAMSQGQR